MCFYSQLTIYEICVALVPSPILTSIFHLGGGQGFGLHDDSSKKMPPFPPTSASRAQEEPQRQQPVIISNSTILRSNPSTTDTRCQVNEDAERRFQQLSGSVHKVGMVLDSVQTDVFSLTEP